MIPILKDNYKELSKLKLIQFYKLMLKLKNKLKRDLKAHNHGLISKMIVNNNLKNNIM